MKTTCKILIVLLFLSSIVNLAQWKYSRELTKRIHNKDKAITEIKKFIKVIAQANNSVESISSALKKNFNVWEDIMQSEIDSSFRFTITPKDWTKIDHKGIWEFYGLDVVFDKQKKFKKLDFYKP